MQLIYNVNVNFSLEINCIQIGGAIFYGIVKYIETKFLQLPVNGVMMLQVDKLV